MNFKKILYSPIIQDTKLSEEYGRIVIYKDELEYSSGPSRDHNDLLRSLASKYKFNKDEVIGNAIRLYYLRYDDTIIVSERRRIDYEELSRNMKYYGELIKRKLH
jgi:hypothetical protein